MQPDGILPEMQLETADTRVDARAFRAFQRLAVATVGLLDPRAIARAVVQCAIELFEVKDVSLYVVNESGQLTSFADVTQEGWERSSLYANPDGFRAEVLRTGQPLV